MLFSLENCECHLVLRPGYIGCVALHYPYCAAVGANGGLSIWDLISGNELKTFGDKKFWELHYNGRFLAASEIVSGCRNRAVENMPKLTVNLFDIKGNNLFENTYYLYLYRFDSSVWQYWLSLAQAVQSTSQAIHPWHTDLLLCHQQNSFTCFTR